MNKYVIFSHYYDTENNRVLDGKSPCSWHPLDDDTAKDVDFSEMTDEQMEFTANCKEDLLLIDVNKTDEDKRNLEEKHILPSLNPHNPKHNMFFIYKGFNQLESFVTNRYEIKDVTLDNYNKSIDINILNVNTKGDNTITGNYIVDSTDSNIAYYTGTVKRNDLEFVLTFKITHATDPTITTSHTYQFQNIVLTNNYTGKQVVLEIKNVTGDNKKIGKHIEKVVDPLDSSKMIDSLKDDDGFTGSVLEDSTSSITADKLLLVSSTGSSSSPIIISKEKLYAEAEDDSITIYYDKMQRIQVDNIWFYRNKVLSLKDLETKVKRFVSIYGKENILIGKEVDLKEYIDFI